MRRLMLLLQAFYDVAFVSIFSTVHPSVRPYSIRSVHRHIGSEWGRERELSEKYENMQIKLEDPRFSAAAINIFERDDSGRRRMSETSQ